MTIQQINDKIRVHQTELSVSRNGESRQELQRKISVLQLKKEIETIKQKIIQLERL